MSTSKRVDDEVVCGRRARKIAVERNRIRYSLIENCDVVITGSRGARLAQDETLSVYIFRAL